MTAMDIPQIRVAVRDRIQIPTQRVANPIANRLFKKPETEGSTYVSHDPERELSKEYEVMYTLCRNMAERHVEMSTHMVKKVPVPHVGTSMRLSRKLDRESLARFRWD